MIVVTSEGDTTVTAAPFISALQGYHNMPHTDIPLSPGYDANGVTQSGEQLLPHLSLYGPCVAIINACKHYLTNLFVAHLLTQILVRQFSDKLQNGLN